MVGMYCWWQFRGDKGVKLDDEQANAEALRFPPRRPSLTHAFLRRRTLQCSSHLQAILLILAVHFPLSRPHHSGSRNFSGQWCYAGSRPQGHHRRRRIWCGSPRHHVPRSGHGPRMYPCEVGCPTCRTRRSFFTFITGLPLRTIGLPRFPWRLHCFRVSATLCSSITISPYFRML